MQELVRCAAALVKPGGLILYVTCALSEVENDGRGLEGSVLMIFFSQT